MSTKTNLTALILAGGIGSRLRPITDLPKPIVPVFGKPYLFYVLETLKHSGIQRVIVGAGYRSELLVETLRQWNPGLDLSFSIEPEPYGTGGALRWASRLLQTDDCLVLNGDSFCDFDLDPFLEFRDKTPTKSAILSLRVDDCSRYGRLHFDADGRIIRFEEKNALDTTSGWINGGIYLLPSDKLRQLPERLPLSLEKEVFPGWLAEGLFAFSIETLFLDIGTPESFAQKEAFITALQNRRQTKIASARRLP